MRVCRNRILCALSSAAAEGPGQGFDTTGSSCDLRRAGASFAIQKLYKNLTAIKSMPAQHFYELGRFRLIAGEGRRVMHSDKTDQGKHFRVGDKCFHWGLFY